LYLREKVLRNFHELEIRADVLTKINHVGILIIFQTHSQRFDYLWIFLESHLQRNFSELLKLSISITGEHKSGHKIQIKINIRIKKMKAFQRIGNQVPAKTV
jgi:hypothetical protein